MMNSFLLTQGRKVLLFMLAGMLLPLGYIWLPYLVNCRSERDLALRRRLTWINVATTVTGFAVMIPAMVHAIGSLDATGVFAVPTWAFIVQLLVPVSVVALFIGNWHTFRS